MNKYIVVLASIYTIEDATKNAAAFLSGELLTHKDSSLTYKADNAYPFYDGDIILVVAETPEEALKICTKKEAISTGAMVIPFDHVDTFVINGYSKKDKS